MEHVTTVSNSNAFAELRWVLTTNNDMIKRMLEVMENVTERLAQLEEKK